MKTFIFWDRHDSRNWHEGGMPFHNHLCGNPKPYRIVVIFLTPCFAYLLALKMEAIYSSETSVDFRLLHNVMSQNIEFFTNFSLKKIILQKF
jgi:hypothetical protein